MAFSVASASGSMLNVDFERLRSHSFKTGTVISNSCVSEELPVGSEETVPVISQQYLSASSSLSMSRETMTSSVSFAPSETDVSDSDGVRLPGFEQAPSVTSSTTRLTSVCCWPVFSTTRVHSVVSSPPHVLLETTIDKSTPKSALPDPSPAVVVTVEVSVAGCPGTSGGSGDSVAVAETVVSQDDSALTVSVTVMVASS